MRRLDLSHSHHDKNQFAELDAYNSLFLARFIASVIKVPKENRHSPRPAITCQVIVESWLRCHGLIVIVKIKIIHELVYGSGLTINVSPTIPIKSVASAAAV